MITATAITGANLPDSSLVLTYDDGPGPNTLAVAEYLSFMKIEATFFIVGRLANTQRDVLARVRELGHRLGNHTWTHYQDGGLPGQLKQGGNLVDELRQTAVLLNDTDTPIAFRAPYGEWSPEVATVLSGDESLNTSHVGHIHWDIHSPDWAAWRDGVDPTVVATWFRVEANTRKKGIVLLHDHTADYEIIAKANRSPELTRALVPMLIADGFQFVPLDAALT